MNLVGIDTRMWRVTVRWVVDRFEWVSGGMDEWIDGCLSQVGSWSV